MLGLVGFLGELIEFSITKLAGNKLDLALDKRKRIAKAFFRLYQSLELIEKASMEFVYQARDGLSSGNRRILYRVPIDKIAKDIDSASDTFFKVFEELKQFISLYDEELFKILWGVSLGKATIVTSLLRKIRNQGSLEISANPQSVFFVSYSYPSEDSLNTFLEKLYQSIQRLDIQSLQRLDIQSLRRLDTRMVEGQLQWPGKLLSSSIGQLNFDIHSASFSDNDRENIAEFTDVLEEHLKLLQSARKSLAKFIQENFSFDDLF